MNVFFEFHKIAKRLQDSETHYALIGGVAMAFYGPLRATKDIDFLINEKDFSKVKTAIEAEGFSERGEPMKFSSGMTLHRFLKFDVNEDMPMIVDVLLGQTDFHQHIIKNADKKAVSRTGNVYLAKPEDMIWLKKKRSSIQDQQDIQLLEKYISENEN